MKKAMLKMLAGTAEAQAELSATALKATVAADGEDIKYLQQILSEVSEEIGRANDLITARTILFERAMNKIEV